MTATLSGLLSSLLGLVAFAAVVFVALRVAQSIFGTDTKRAAATEVGAKLVAYPTGSAGVLRRRFVRALTRQHVIMPSGERHAFSELTVRIAPEDLERLDPDGDLDRLGADGAKLYLAHAKREGWATPREVTVVVEVDPGLRSGWVPPARGTGRASVSRGLGAPREEQPRERPEPSGWDVVVDQEATGLHPAPSYSAPAPTPPARGSGPATVGFPALVPDPPDDDAPTMNVARDLTLEHDGQVVVVPRRGTTVLGRLPGSPLRLDEPEVSYRHAAIRLLAGRWHVKDLGSTNGTAVDGQRLEDDSWTSLRSGAVITLAGVPVVASTESSGTVNLEGVTSR